MTYYIMVKMLLQYQSGYSMTLLVFIVFYHISNQVKCRHYSIFRKLLHYRVLQSPKKGNKQMLIVPFPIEDKGRCWWMLLHVPV